MTTQNRPPQILYSTWKQIAGALGVSVGTAKRWNKLHRLPVRRGPTGGPVALPEEIEEWARENCEPM